MRVLSLFDGMSCGMQALKDIGVQVDRYDASEIDKSAITVSKGNHPEINHIGDVRKLSFEKGSYDLIIAGSPCQGFSFAGNKLNFQHPKSILYFDFLRILREVQPKYFLLENVKMRAQFRDIITKDMGCEPTLRNSSLFVPQNRERNYWTNIPQEDKLNPVLKYTSVEDVLTGLDKEYIWSDRYEFSPVESKLSKSGILPFGGLLTKSKRRWGSGKGISSFSQGYRVYSPKGLSPCLCATIGGYGGYSNLYADDIDDIENTLYRLPRIAMERLQGLPDLYTKSVSINQAGKMLGNGWTTPLISGIFEGLKQV